MMKRNNGLGGIDPQNLTDLQRDALADLTNTTSAYASVGGLIGCAPLCLSYYWCQ